MMHVRQDDFGFEAATARGREGGFRRAMEGFRGWFARREHRAAERRAARHLAMMDPHLLRDIGVSREEAMRLALGDEE